ncbi:conserved lysine-rich [Cordyceps militaris]|uniref:Conserved lysine-rich n=1 Tax=Cordyceps militaris TaxID=73501 RepID=A0A2H4S5H7_CORMI|nr:conserved lysine-rich [Cordyceps militaris]
MADIQKPIEVPAAAVEQAPNAVPETAPVLDVPAATDAAAPLADEAKPEEPVAAEETKEEVKPVEEGHLGYKAHGLSFPKNLLGSKEFFFFSSEATEAKALEAYKKAQKSAEGALDNISWAAHTGKGLLFSGDKKAPHNVINLSHASEPEVEGNKFHFTAKGNKHTFKAANAAERDNWVAQIKAKIAEAKEIAASVTESETYKNTLESLKPAPKEEAKAAEPADESAEVAKADEAPKEDGEAPKEESKVEEPKRRSASRKRASFFGFGKKDILPKDEVKTEETPAEAAEETAAPAEVTDATAEAANQDAEATEEPTAEVVKPTANKRNSFFGGVFSKKEKKAAEPKAAEATEAAAEETEGAAETAPVIPPVDTTTPLAEEVIAADPVEAAAPETKTDVKEKRKSSLPFFGKRDASPTTGEAKTGAFSKLRATIKGKGAVKAEEAKEEAAKAQETATDAKDKTEETAADIKEQVTNAVEGEGEKKTEATPVAPAVTASA